MNKKDTYIYPKFILDEITIKTAKIEINEMIVEILNFKNLPFKKKFIEKSKSETMESRVQ